jgi:tight adherence protein C
MLNPALLPIILAAGSAAGVLLFFIGIALRQKPDEVQTRLDYFASQARNLEELELQQPFKSRIIQPIVSGLSNAITKRTPSATVEQMRLKLVIAGSPSGLDVGEFILLKVIFGIVLGAFSGFLVIRSGNVMMGLLMGVVFLALGWYLPGIWLSSKTSQRKQEITRSLPDALDLLTISVEAGLGFDAALAKVCEKWNNALTKEFRRVLTEMRMGRTRRDALKDVVNRTDVPDVNAFIAAIIQADQLGVSVSKVLHVQADQMRVRRRQRAEESAHKAPVKMIFPMVFLIFPALFVVILGPSIPTMLNGFGM